MAVQLEEVSSHSRTTALGYYEMAKMLARVNLQWLDNSSTGSFCKPALFVYSASCTEANISKTLFMLLRFVFVQREHFYIIVGSS